MLFFGFLKFLSVHQRVNFRTIFFSTEWYKTQSSGKENFENLPNEELAAMLEGLYKNGYQQQPDIYTSHTLKG